MSRSDAFKRTGAQRSRVKALATALVVLAGLLTGSVHGAPVYVQNVPDWNQPTLVDVNLPAPGPVGNVNIPAAGATTAWCAPTASANIMGYYRDTAVGLTIADNAVFPATTALPAVDWRDDAVDNLSGPLAVARQDLGWYMNTNSQGDPLAPIQAFGVGTHYRNMVPGLGSYFTAHALAPGLIMYTNPASGAAGADNSGVAPANRTVANAYARLVGEVDAGRPALLHLMWWNLIQRAQVRASGEPVLPDYDNALWGGQVGAGPGGEQYGDDLGHTVTLAGYWNGAAGPVAGHPFSGQGVGGSTPNAVIVHDDADGTLPQPADATATRALPVALPFSVNDNAGLNVPWAGQTEISNVPEPATLSLLAIGAVVLIRRRAKRR